MEVNLQRESFFVDVECIEVVPGESCYVKKTTATLSISCLTYSRPNPAEVMEHRVAVTPRPLLRLHYLPYPPEPCHRGPQEVYYLLYQFGPLML